MPILMKKIYLKQIIINLSSIFFKCMLCGTIKITNATKCGCFLVTSEAELQDLSCFCISLF